MKVWMEATLKRMMRIMKMKMKSEKILNKMIVAHVNIIYFIIKKLFLRNVKYAQWSVRVLFCA